MIEMGLFTKDQSLMEIGVILADVHITYFEANYFGQNIKVGVHAAKLIDVHVRAFEFLDFLVHLTTCLPLRHREHRDSF